MNLDELIGTAVEWFNVASIKLKQNDHCATAFALGCCTARIQQLVEELETRHNGTESDGENRG